MKILQIVTRSEAGGAQSVIASLAAEFHSRGHEVAIASGPEGGGAAWRGFDPEIYIYEIDGLMRAISPRNELKALMAIRSLYIGWQPDIVHLHTSKAGALGRIADGMPRGRIVYTMHGFDQLRVSNRKFLAIDRALRSACGAVVAVSECDRAAMTAEGYRPVLIRNGTPDAPKLMPADPELVSRLEALRRSGLPLVMLVARDSVPKRVDLARAAAARLEGAVNFAWIGGKPKGGDPPNFHALGVGAGAGAYLRFADLFLLLSEHEGLSMSLLEAFSAGLPCVTSAIDGCLEAMGIGEAGRAPMGLVVPNEAGAIAVALAELAASSDERHTMGAAARAAWEEKYSSSAMAEGYLALYEKLLARSHS
jgi:glycosyltransferase involved in cell wall biosynthesis